MRLNINFATIFDLCLVTHLSVFFSGRQLERVGRVVGVHARVREAAQQRVHRPRTQARRASVRRGGAGHGQLHGRPVHAEWVPVVQRNSPPPRVCHPRLYSLAALSSVEAALITAALIRLHRPSPRL